MPALDAAAIMLRLYDMPQAIFTYFQLSYTEICSGLIYRSAAIKLCLHDM